MRAAKRLCAVAVLAFFVCSATICEAKALSSTSGARDGRWRRLGEASAAGGGAVAAAASSSTTGVDAAIAFGEEAARGQFGYIAALIGDKDMSIGCGGMLVRPRLVLTAAHCLFDRKTRKTEVVKKVAIGLLDWQKDVANEDYEVIPVQRAVVHNNYLSPKASSDAYDIAVLVLARPAKTRPVAMAPAKFRLVSGDEPDWLLVAGWGATEDAEASLKLLYADVPYYSWAECNKIYTQDFKMDPLPKTHFCAGYEDDGQDACPGDSGGPLVKVQPNGRHLLVGIVSYGPNDDCGGFQNLGAYTSVMALRGWIEAQIRLFKV